MKTPLTFGCIVILIMMHPFSSFCQKRLGQTVINANSGVSLVGMFASMGANANASNDVIRSGPALITHTDVGLGKKISIGPSASYQSIRYYYDRDTDLGKVRYKDVVTRANIGGRILVHMGDEEDADNDKYMGVRVGYTYWKYSSDNPDGYQISNQPRSIRTVLKTGKLIHTSTQLVFGYRHYFNRFIGINYEFSIGGPVFFSAGVTSRFF
jgi:hypothetical protein